jgi:Zn finger protein HypA/HybF involved in hydrogenase expression
MDAQMLDGNAIAGMLQEVFAVEMTTAIETCRSCGASDALGAAHVYRGAGTVLLCPHCHNPLVKIVRDDTRMWLGFPGLAMLEVAV